LNEVRISSKEIVGKNIEEILSSRFGNVVKVLSPRVSDGFLRATRKIVIGLFDEVPYCGNCQRELDIEESRVVGKEFQTFYRCPYCGGNVTLEYHIIGDPIAYDVEARDGMIILKNPVKQPIRGREYPTLDSWLK